MNPNVYIANTTGVFSCSINSSHGSNTAVANIDCISHSLDIGDKVSIYAGESEATKSLLFVGYVKSIEHKIPDDTYNIVIHDSLIRAVDYFVASANPNAPFTRHGIKAEILVKDVLALSGLTLTDYEVTNFTFGINTNVEVNLTSAYDYCKMIGDIIAWHLWAENDESIHFENRKPFIMTGTSSQPGDTTDETVIGAADFTVDDTNIAGSDAIISALTYTVNERNLRNRVVVYGSSGIYAEAKVSSPYLPSGFYKTAVVATPILDNQTYAQQSADYNLNLYNKLTTAINVELIPTQITDFMQARKILRLKYTPLTINSNWYIYACTLNITKGGYTVNLDLRQ